MRTRVRIGPWLLAAAMVIAACDNDDGKGGGPETDDTDTGADADTDIDTDTEEPAGSVIAFVAVDGDHGDIDIAFSLEFEEGEARDVSLFYDGGCEPGSWNPALVDGPLAGLGAGVHTATWWSWDQEAGCSGPVSFLAVTDLEESAVSDPIELANTGEQSGFVRFPQEQQGINPHELDWWLSLKNALLPDPGVDFVATRIEDRYEVHAARGAIEFVRLPTRNGYEYEVTVISGTNPIGNQDPTLIPTLAEELAYGSNPNGATFTGSGYGAGDPRLSFIELEDEIYPFGYERIAAYFDHPDSADAMIDWAGYAHFDYNAGNHGSLNMIQSRSPLIIWGPGVDPGPKQTIAKAPDIAPTVARLLGMPTTSGVDRRGIRSRTVHLAWQDGAPLEDFLNGDTVSHVIIVIADGLTHTALHDKIDRDPGSVPHLKAMRDGGAWAEYGITSNWPSVTYPGHNVVGSGLWSGHHGVVGNSYYLRDTNQVASPISQLFNTGHYWNPLPVHGETLHMAVHRAFGNWAEDNLTGAYTASIFCPSVVGANTADLEFHDDSGQMSFPLDTLIPAPGVPWPNVPITDLTVWAEQMSEMFAMTAFRLLFTNGVSPLPRYVIMNWPTTDGCGHKHGPNSNRMDDVLEHMDANFKVIAQWLQSWGIIDQTAIIFTSDHGMQLADPTRSRSPLDALDAAGVDYVKGIGLGIYSGL